MIVGCYTLDLYCDFEHAGDDMPRQFTGRTEAACLRTARKAGWAVSMKADRCRCPKHRGKRTSSTNEEMT